MNVHEEKMFKTCLGLVNSDVTIIDGRNGKQLTGKVANSMFDSLLLESQGKVTVVRFCDIYSIESKPGSQN